MQRSWCNWRARYPVPLAGGGFVDRTREDRVAVENSRKIYLITKHLRKWLQTGHHRLFYGLVSNGSLIRRVDVLKLFCFKNKTALWKEGCLQKHITHLWRLFGRRVITTPRREFIYRANIQYNKQPIC